MAYVVNGRRTSKELIEKYKATFYKMNAQDIFKRNFNFLMLLRKIFIVFCVVSAYSHPFVVALMLCLCSFVFLIIIYMVQPYFNRDLNIFALLIELLLIFIFGCMSKLALIYEDDRVSAENWSIVLVVLLFLPLFFFFIYSLLQLRKVLIERRRVARKRKVISS